MQQLPQVDLASIIVDPAHFDLIPSFLCIDSQFLPLAVDGQRMVIGLVRPISQSALDGLRRWVRGELFFVQLSPAGGPLPPWPQLHPCPGSPPPFEPHPQAEQACQQFWPAYVESQSQQEEWVSPVPGHLLTDFGYLYSRLCQDKEAAATLYRQMKQATPTDLLHIYLEFWKGRQFLFSGDHPEQILLALADHCAQDHPVSRAARSWLSQNSVDWLQLLFPPAHPQHYPLRIPWKAWDSLRPALTPNGRYLLTLGKSISVLLPSRRWLAPVVGTAILAGNEAVVEVRPGRLIVQPLNPEQPTLTLSHPDLGGVLLAVTPDLRRLITCSSNQIKIWNLPGPTCVATLIVEGQVEEISLSSDGLRLMAIHDKYRLSRWQLDPGGQPRRRARGFTPWDNDWAPGYGVDARGRLVSAAFDLGPAEDLDEFVYQAPWVLLGKGDSLFLLRDDQALAHWQTTSERSVLGGPLEVAWDRYGKGFQVRGGANPDPCPGSVLDFALSADGLRGLSLGSDGQGRLWDLSEGVRYLGRISPVGARAGALDATGRRALLSDGQGLTLWDLEQDCLLCVFDPVPEEISHCSFVDSDQVAVLGAEWVFVYSLRSPDPPLQIARDAPKFVRGICAQRMLACYEAPTKHRWGPLRVRDLARGRRIPLAQPTAKPHSFHKFAGAKNRPLLATCNQEGNFNFGCTLRVWDLAGEEALLRNRWRLESCLGFDISDQGEVAVAADGLQLYPAQPVPDAPLWVHDSVVSELVLSDDGTILASGSCDQTVAVFNLENGQCCGRYPGHGFWAYPELSADGRWLLVHSDGGNWLHDRRSGQQRAGRFALSRGGLVVSLEEGALAVYQAHDWRLLHRYSQHQHPVTAFKVSPYADDLMVSGDSAGHLHTWSLRSGETHSLLTEEPKGAIKDLWWSSPHSVSYFPATPSNFHYAWHLTENRSGPVVWGQAPVSWKGSSQSVSPQGHWKATLHPQSPSCLSVEEVSSGLTRQWPTPKNSQVLVFRGPHQLLVGLSTGEILFFQL